MIRSISVRRLRLDVLEHRGVVGAPRAAWRARSSPRDRRGEGSPQQPPPPCPPPRGRRRDRPRSVGLSRAAKWASCGRPVSAATELTVALKISFDHCAGLRSGSASAFRPARTSSVAVSPTRSKRGVLVRAEPGLGVEDVLDVRVGVLGTAHEGDRRDDRPVAVGADDLLRAEPVEHRHHIASGTARERLRCRCQPVAFVATMTRSTGGRSVRIAEGVDLEHEGRCRPLTRRPSAFSASACSRRRVSTQTSATCAR